MDFLGIGPLELAFILIIIFIVIGPKDINKTARSAGRFLNRMYKSDEWKALTQASRTIRTLPNRLAREAELEELNEIKESISSTTSALKEETQTISKEARALNKEAKEISEEMQAWTVAPKKIIEDAKQSLTQQPDGDETQRDSVQTEPESQSGASSESIAASDTIETSQELE